MAVGKGKRFEIFQRDGFTCRYCGRRPPDVILEADHVVPVTSGGTDEDANLVTSCFDCNRGKRANPLILSAFLRPDAELLWLEAQQEAAEVKRYLETVAEREALIGQAVERLRELWCELSGLDWGPSEACLRPMIHRYGPSMVEGAVMVVAPKLGGGYIASQGTGWLRYLWATLRNMKAEAA
jgi:hypothetical protein